MKKLLMPILPLFFILSVSAQHVVKIDTVTNYSIHIVASNFEGVIFSKDYVCEWLKFKRSAGRVYVNDGSNAASGNTDQFNRFTPLVADIISAENLLSFGLKRLNKKLPHVKFIRGPNVYRHLKNYKRQYFGFLNIDKEKIIIFNCFWGTEQITDTFWLQNYYNVFDGGNYYWTIKINLKTHQLFDFGVNGAI